MNFWILLVLLVVPGKEPEMAAVPVATQLECEAYREQFYETAAKNAHTLVAKCLPAEVLF